MKFISKFLGIAALMLFGASAWAEFAPGGDGFYHVATVSDLKSFRDLVNEGDSFAGNTVVLDADLDLNNEEWTPIGTGSRSGSTCSGNNFAGLFDGQNHAIVGLKISSGYSGDKGAGLFGLIKGGEVKNLSVTGDINLSGCECAGILSGLMSDGGIVRGVTTYGTVYGLSGCGGIVGTIPVKGKVFDSVNHANVSGAAGGTNFGGIAGKAYYTITGQTLEDCVVSNCVNYGNIKAGPASETSPGQSAGGIIGLSIASIRNCKNYGVISGVVGNSYGGIVGNSKGYGEIVGCINYAKIGNMNLSCVGGILGYLQPQANGYPTQCVLRIDGNTNWGDITGRWVDGGNPSVAGIMGMSDQGLGYSMTYNVNYGFARRVTDEGVVVEGYAFVAAQNTNYIQSWEIVSNSTATASSSTMYASDMSADHVKDNTSITLAAIDTKGEQYETLEAALAAVSVDTQLAWVNGSMWDPDKQAIYNGNQYATLQDAIVAAVADNANTAAVIYVRPNYDGVAVNHHVAIKTSITIYGNNAKIGSEWEPTVEYKSEESDSGGHFLKKDIDFTICNLHDGAGIWGSRSTDWTVNACMYNCTNAHEVFTDLYSGKGKTNYTIKNCTFICETLGGKSTKWPVTSDNPGDILVENCLFEGVTLAVKAKMASKLPAGETFNMTVKGCTFKNCLGEKKTKGIVNAGAQQEGTFNVVVEDCQFTGTPDGIGDVTLGEGDASRSVAFMTYSIKNTACSLVVTARGTANTMIDTTVEASETPLTGDNVPVVALVVNGDGTVTNEYKKLAVAFANVQNGESIVLMANNSEVITTAPTATSFTVLANGYALTGNIVTPEGYILRDNWDGSYTYMAGKFVAQVVSANGVTTNKYTELVMAFQSVNAPGCTLKLLSDVDLTDVVWPYISWNWPDGPTITVDGNGKTISNLNIDSMSTSYAALIAYASGGLLVKDITFTGANIRGQRSAVVGGCIYKGSFQNVKIEDAAIDGIQKCGGLVGLTGEGNGTPNFYFRAIDCEVKNLAFTGLGEGEDAGCQFGGIVGLIHNDNTVVISGCKTSGISYTNLIPAEWYTTMEKKYYQFVSHPFVACMFGRGANSTITFENNQTVQVAEIPKAPMTTDYIGFFYTGDITDQALSTITVDGKVIQNWAAARIGTTKYMSLAEAFSKVANGQTIVVLHDNDEVITQVPTATSFSFDANGKKLSDTPPPTAEGYMFQQNSDGICVYGQPAVMIGDKAYVTLAGAVAAATADDVIYLVSDLAENLAVPNGKTITFDGSVFKLTGTITLGEGSKLALKGGTFTVEPKFAWLGDAYAIRDNEDGTYTVVTASVAPVQEELPVAEKVTDEKGDPIPEDKQDKAAAAIAELQTNLIEGVQAPVVTKTDTGIHEVVQANAEEIEAGLKQTAVKLGLTVDAQKQIEENMTAFLAGDESATNTADYVQVTIVKFDAVVTETVGGSMTGVPAKVTFEAMPMIAMTVSNVVGGVAEEVVVTNQLTNKMVEDMADLGHLMYFKLPIFDPKATTALVKHLSSGPEYPDETFTSEVKEKDGFRYIEVYTSHFSEFEVTTTGDVYVTCDETIGIFKLDKMDAGEVAFGVPFTKSGVEGSVAITLGELVTTGAQGSDTVKSWVAGGTDTNKYAAVVATDEVAAGKAIWYNRGGDASVPLTLAGYVEKGITTAGAAASAATDRVGMSNFVNPYGVEVNVLAKLQVTPAEGDQIVVEGSATRYFFNEGCWKKRVKGNQIVPDPKVSSDSNRLVYGAQNMEVVLTITVPAGKTFWYLSKETVQSVKW